MGVSSEVATAVAERAVPSKSLKIKILVKKPGLCQNSDQVPEVNCLERFALIDDRTTSAVTKKRKSDIKSNHVKETPQLTKVNCLEMSSLIDSQMSSAVGNDQLSVVGTKRGPERTLECGNSKRLKMDRKATSHLQNTLKKLMRNKFARPFLEAVDPVKCMAADYFDIIKHPMDLGTIKGKLQKNAYSCAEEFEADVRLTFSNAMLYNPPDHFIHQHAKLLNREFEGLWKSVEAILFRDKQKINKSFHNCVDKTVNDVKDNRLKSNSSHADALPVKEMVHKEIKCKSDDPKELSIAGPPSDLKGFKDGNGNVKGPKLSRPNPVSAGPLSHWDKETAAPVSTKVTWKITNRDKVCAKELNAVEVKNTSTLLQSRSDQDSEGTASCVDEEHTCASTPAAAGSLGTATLSLEAVLDSQLSPSKVLRAAKLRSRYADTIIKAQTKLQPIKGGRFDGTSLQEEKERFERKQLEEKARIEAQVRAAELAERLKVEGELKKQREQARAALEKMERSTDLDDNFHTLKELEALVGSSLFIVRHGCRGRKQEGINKSGSPLENLGLYIKAEYRVGDDDDDDEDEELSKQGMDMEMEDGEIIL